ncbi:MAG: SoxR reducing system RseC family protein [Thermodesulfobacteriota bacterium]|nr:SoxR reducing system RseC family protein [Thermodesulfobacteriota bacterium]
MAHIREEEGEVIAVEGNQAKVRIRRSPACDSCSSSSSCGLLGKGEMVLTALNPIGASEGQKVDVSFKVEGGVKASFILYLIPVVGLVAGALIGYSLHLFGDKEISAAVFSLLFVALTFLGIKYYAHIRYAKDQSYIPKITKVVA